MVKADVKRDYYADLELQQNATPEEIKKSFRKLGWFIVIVMFVLKSANRD